MLTDPKPILTWVLALGVPMAAAMILNAFLTLIPYDVMLEIVRVQFAAIIGLPIAAVFSVFLVVVLQQTTGPIKFQGLGLQFEGTSGQVVLWIMCFMAIASAIKLLWV